MGCHLAGAKNGKIVGKRLNIVRSAAGAGVILPIPPILNLQRIRKTDSDMATLNKLWKIFWHSLLAFCLILLISSLGLGLSLAWADSPPATPVTEEVEAANKSASASDIASEKVSQFIQSYLQVLSLVEQREPILQAAETQLEASQLEREIELEAWGLVEKNGLTRQEYLQLLGLANSDTEFGERIAAQLQEAD